MLRWCGTFIVIAISICGTAEGSLLSGTLGELKCARIVIEDLPSVAKQFGISKDAIEDTVMVGIRSRVPRVTLDSGCTNRVRVVLTMIEDVAVGGNSLGYSGVVVVELMRSVEITETGALALVAVWTGAKLYGGPTETADTRTIEEVEEQLRKFAADYYKAGNE